MIIKIRRAIKNYLKTFNKRRLMHGTAAVALTALFIAAVVLVNIVAGMAFDLVAIDTTSMRLYSIENSTVEYLSSLNDDVTITVMSRENDFLTQGHRQFYEQTNEILKRFAAANPRITVRYLDLMSNPDFAQRYDGLRADSIIVESGKTGRHRILNTQNYINITYYELQGGTELSEDEYYAYAAMGMGDWLYADVSAAAEGAFLSAVLTVTNPNPSRIAWFQGFGETINAQLGVLLTQNGYEISEVDIVTEEIPDDFDFAVVYAPTSDYADHALTKIAAWLDNGGQFGKTLIYVSHHSTVTPKIDSFLEEWGLSVERAFVLQSDERYVAPLPQLELNIQYCDPKAFTDGLNPDYRVFADFMRPTVRLFEAQDIMETAAVLSTFDGAFLYPHDMDEDEAAEFDYTAAPKAAFEIAALSRKSRFEPGGNFEQVSSTVVAFGGNNVFSPNFLQMGNSNNAAFILGMFNEISGSEITVTILPKTFSVAMFQISQSQARVIGATFALVLPTIVIVTGVVIWLRRRYR